MEKSAGRIWLCVSLSHALVKTHANVSNVILGAPGSHRHAGWGVAWGLWRIGGL